MIPGIIRIIKITFQDRQLTLELQVVRGQAVKILRACLDQDAKDLVEEFLEEE